MTRKPSDIPNRLILTGPPGSGKTRKLLDLFHDSRRDGKEHRSLFIVPDSLAREHIRDIIARFSPDDVPKVFSDEGIHSLQSLTKKLAGTPSATPVHLRSLISECIDNGHFDINRYRSLNTPGGKNALARSVLDLRRYSHSTNSIATTLKNRGADDSPLLIALRHWEEYLKNENKTDELDILKKAVRIAGEKNHWDLVLIDGFTEIQPLHWELVEALIDCSNKTCAAIDPDLPPSSHLLDKFSGLGFTMENMETSARWDGSDNLGWLSTITNWGPDASPPSEILDLKVSQKPEIIRAADPRIEAAMLARKVAELVSDGWNYPDIVIITPDLASYRNVLSTEFCRAGIPIRFYADSPLLDSGSGELMKSILTVISGDWSDKTVTRLISNPLSGVHSSEAENAIRETSAKRRLGTKNEWLRWSKGQTNGLLRKLSALQESALVDPIEFGNDLLDLTGENIRKSWKKLPDEQLAHEGWAWSQVESLVVKSTRALSDIKNKLPAQKISGFLLTELETSKGRPFDRSRDCVNAVSLLGARTWGVPVAMVCGLSRNSFPHKSHPDPFLTDNLRMELDPPLPTVDELRERELALFRVAVTRARDRLILSWPETDSGCAPLLPAGPLEKCLEWLYEGLPPENFTHDPPTDIQNSIFPKDIAAIAFEAKVDDENLANELRSRLTTPIHMAEIDRQFDNVILNEPAELVTSACGTMESPITPTHINNLAQCPYRFFASRLLKLRESHRDHVSNGFDYLQQGNIAHEALAQWFRSGKKTDFEPLIRKALNKRHEIVKDSVTEGRIRQIIDTLENFKKFESENIQTLGFSQEFAELEFGSRRESESSNKAIPIDLDEKTKITIGGRIDRLDLKNKKIALVADYKRSEKKSDFKSLEVGRNFQLAFYIMLLEKSLSLDVGMACFLPLRKINVGGAGKALVNTDLVTGINEKAFNLKNVISPADHIEFAKEKISQLIELISSGVITPNPADLNLCRDKCTYRDLCRFRFTGDEGLSEGGDD